MIRERGNVCCDTWNALATTQNADARTSADAAVGRYMQGRRLAMVEGRILEECEHMLCILLLFNALVAIMCRDATRVCVERKLWNCPRYRTCTCRQARPEEERWRRRKLRAATVHVAAASVGIMKPLRLTLKRNTKGKGFASE